MGPLGLPWWLSDKESAWKETQKMWVWSLGWEDLLEEEMATHSGILAWTMPWTEESGWLPSMGSQRAGHDLATKQQWTLKMLYKQDVLLSFPICFSFLTIAGRQLQWYDGSIRDLQEKLDSNLISPYKLWDPDTITYSLSASLKICKVYICWDDRTNCM